MVDVDTVIDLASGMVTHSLVSSDRPGPPPEALPGSVDVSVRPDQTNRSLQYVNIGQDTQNNHGRHKHNLALTSVDS